MQSLPSFSIVLLLLTSASFAHDLYLVSGVKDARGKLCARIGEEFPESANAVTADRLNSFSFQGADGKRVGLTGKVQEKQFCAALPARPPAVVEMTVQPRFIKLEAHDFSGYLEGEGLLNVQTLRRARNQEDAPGRELYSRYAKLLIGPVGSIASKPLGHALEIVPAKDPGELSAAEPLLVTVLFQGRPLPDVQVSAVYAGVKLKGHSYPISTRTDSDGRAVLKLDRAGLWYARLIYMTPAQDDPEVDWRSYFATLTFEVPPGRTVASTE
ncbi:MAG: DUF4198 domain-containing protein [Acidobacteriales bacterium]|nr:DUF4198 domain-containing protein [Candidatus Koribacter versatilis]MBI3645435.1 DUF4198 domain-containing protein [Terriglobales bacterium]